MKVFYKKVKKHATRYYFCGMRLYKKDNKFLELKEELMTWYSYSTDLTQLPKVQGPMGIIQQANLMFFQKISSIFNKHHIRHSIWAGTLLGAIRHKGFIPWDDDIDVMVFDEDYQKIEQVIALEFKDNPDIYTTTGDCIRIFYRGTTCQIDCFPFLTYHNYLEKEEDREKLRKKIEKYNKKCKHDRKQKSVGKTLLVSEKQIYKWMDEVLIPNPNENRKMLVSRIGHGSSPHLYDYDWVFPLKKMMFDGFEFWGPNKPEIILYMQYGDYMKLPPDFHLHQDITSRLNPQSLNKMIEMIKEQKS